MSDKLLAISAYEIYCETVGDDLEPWSDLLPEVRRAWMRVVSNLREEFALENDGEDYDYSEPGSLFDNGDDEDDDA